MVAVLLYGVSTAEAMPRELSEDFGRQANLMEEAEARGLGAHLQREGLEVRLEVKGSIEALVSLCGWALEGDVCWPDRLLVEGEEAEDEAEAALENDARTKGYMEVARVA